MLQYWLIISMIKLHGTDGHGIIQHGIHTIIILLVKKHLILQMLRIAPYFEDQLKRSWHRNDLIFEVITDEMLKYFPMKQQP